MNEASFTLRLRSEHCDLKRRLRIDTLLHLLQECSVSHTQQLGMGREKTLDQGLLWVIDKEVVRITRLPEYDEEITILTSPGKTLHYFFPRRAEIRAKDGTVLIKAMTLWSLMDEKTREIIDPEEHGIVIDGEDRKNDLKIMTASLPKSKLTKAAYLKAEYTDCDLNGHLNHAGYVNFAQNRLPEAFLLGHELASLSMTFLHEVKLGEKTKVNYGSQGTEWCFSSRTFRLMMDYRNCEKASE